MTWLNSEIIICILCFSRKGLLVICNLERSHIKLEFCLLIVYNSIQSTLNLLTFSETWRHNRKQEQQLIYFCWNLRVSASYRFCYAMLLWDLNHFHVQKKTFPIGFLSNPWMSNHVSLRKDHAFFIGFPITISKPRILSFGWGSGNNKEFFYTLHFSLEPDTSSSTMVTIIVTRKKYVKIIFVWLGYYSIVKYHQNVNFEESDTEPSLGRNYRFSLLPGILNNVY